MAQTDTQKIKLLNLFLLLFEHSDEEHRLSTKDISDMMRKDGIEVCERVIARDIQVLRKFGFEVQEVRGKYKEYYIADRRFEIAELRVLIDAVQAANFIPSTQTARLVDKIASLAGEHKSEVLKRDTVSFDVKHTNRVVFYSIDTIQTALEQKKKVSFTYFDWVPDGKKYRKDGKRYIVDPVGLFYANENYYLNCFTQGHNDANNYRVDRMESVEIEVANAEERIPSEIYTIRKAKAFGQFMGKPTRVQLLVEDGAYNGIVDKFGHDVDYKRESQTTVSVFVPVQVSNMFFAWVAASRGKVRIEYPREVKTKYQEFLKEITENS